MGYSNKLTQMARELLNIEADLPYRFDYSNERPTIDNFTLYTFEQLWFDTTYGFGGIGGQAFTSARIYVFVPIIGNQKCFIYIGDRFAYKADWCDALKEDIDNHNIEYVARSSKYRKD